ncbi:hypothetical protein H6G33_23615 [Calothrix sp. FACHB-1219]|uniref:hypothetical protein n=1 Tax=unclassified Calothrix TaxID=2619626 RepID=UPI0016898E69|nr:MULTISPECIES: hypothetical protein [unclassified Calothrix]MBD2203692.1 hypothetical protein [Calothrix sp. FACHB-168]MBD2219998.1 hypothetical protein [Calothrix sp. FACHB-1219]
MPNAQCPLTIYVLSTIERSLYATSYHLFTYLNGLPQALQPISTKNLDEITNLNC